MSEGFGESCGDDAAGEVKRGDAYVAHSFIACLLACLLAQLIVLNIAANNGIRRLQLLHTE